MNPVPAEQRRQNARTWVEWAVAGAVGGTVVAGTIVGILAIKGGVMSSTTTVTIMERPIAPVAVSKRRDSLTAGQVYQRDDRGVVFVNASEVGSQSTEEYLRGEGGGPTLATGSGFEVGDSGLIVTNWHVVEGAAKITVESDYGAVVKAQLVGKVASDDLALLRISVAGRTLHPLMLGNSSAANVGDEVFAIGNPFGLGGTLTTGVISALNRQITAPDGTTISGALQTDAPINPGNSGGPLINDEGEVIGINSQIETSGDRSGNVGIAFAIPIDIVKRDLSKFGVRP